MWGKSELIAAVTPTNLGLKTSAPERQSILSEIARLEDRNPTPDPLGAPDLLAGNWRLLYTTSQELLNIDRLPFYQLGPIYQCIRLPEQRIYNIAEVTGIPGLEGLISVSARFEPVSTHPKRVNVHFERGVLGAQRLLGYQNPTDFMSQLTDKPRLPIWQGIDFRINSDRPPGWLEVTYLDHDLRIGRGNQGSVFVLRKVS
jgi:hypothetical protein